MASMQELSRAEAIGTMMLHIIRAEHLKEKGWTGTQDPFVTVVVGPARHAGDVVPDGGTEPIFNTKLFFDLEGKETHAEICVLDKKIIHNRTIGKIHLDILRLLTNNGPTWYKLEGDCGNLLIDAQFRGTLRGEYMNNMDESNYALAKAFQMQAQQAVCPPCTTTTTNTTSSYVAPVAYAAAPAPTVPAPSSEYSARKITGPLPPAGAVGTMVIHLMRGQHLKDRNWVGGKQDPFVSLELGPDGWQQQKSQVVKEGGTDPLFDQKFVFNLDGRETTLDLHVYDKGALMNKTIGKAYIPIEQLVDGGSSNWFELEDGRGLIQMRSQFRGHIRGREIDNLEQSSLAPISQPHVTAAPHDNITGAAPLASAAAVGPGVGAVGSLVIHAIRGERLKDKEWKGGKQDPYLVFELGPRGKQRQETTVIKEGGTEPFFDQKFLFNLEGDETTLDIHAYHKGSVLKHSIGKCYIPLDALLSNDSSRWFHLENEGGSIQLRGQFRGTVRGSPIDTIKSDSLAVYPSTTASSASPGVTPPGAPLANTGTGLESRLGQLNMQPQQQQYNPHV